MKKTLLSIALTIATLAGYAQTTVDSTKNSPLKPTARTLTTELNFNPFKGNLSLNNSLNQIKLRYFITPEIAIRLGFNASRKDSTVNVNNPYGVQSNFNRNERKSTTVGVNIGVEKHFKGTRRLSPYVAVDVSLSNRSSNQEIKDNASSTSVKNGWIETIYSNNNSYYTQNQENAYFQYGVDLITGFDFYIAKNFFCGYEFNFSLSKTDYKNTDVTITGQTNTIITDTGKKSTSTFGPTLMNGVRIGYSF